MSGISYMTEDMYSQAEITEYSTIYIRFIPTHPKVSGVYIARTAEGSASKVLVR